MRAPRRQIRGRDLGGDLLDRQQVAGRIVARLPQAKAAHALGQLLPVEGELDLGRLETLPAARQGQGEIRQPAVIDPQGRQGRAAAAFDRMGGQIFFHALDDGPDVGSPGGRPLEAGLDARKAGQTDDHRRLFQGLRIEGHVGQLDLQGRLLGKPGRIVHPHSRGLAAAGERIQAQAAHLDRHARHLGGDRLDHSPGNLAHVPKGEKGRDQEQENHPAGPEEHIFPSRAATGLRGDGSSHGKILSWKIRRREDTNAPQLPTNTERPENQLALVRVDSREPGLFKKGSRRLQKTFARLRPLARSEWRLVKIFENARENTKKNRAQSNLP